MLVEVVVGIEQRRRPDTRLDCTVRRSQSACSFFPASRIGQLHTQAGVMKRRSQWQLSLNPDTLASGEELVKNAKSWSKLSLSRQHAYERMLGDIELFIAGGTVPPNGLSGVLPQSFWQAPDLEGEKLFTI